MRTLVKKFRDFLRQNDGPTVVEYAVLLVLIVFGALTAISLLGVNLSTTIASTAEALPLGTSGEDSSESSPGEEDDEKGEKGRRGKRRRGGRGLGRRGRGRRSSILPASSSSLVRYT